MSPVSLTTVQPVQRSGNLLIHPPFPKLADYSEGRSWRAFGWEFVEREGKVGVRSPFPQ